MIKVLYNSEKSIDTIMDDYYNDFVDGKKYAKTATVKEHFGFTPKDSLNIEDLYAELIKENGSFKSVFSKHTLRSILVKSPDKLPGFITEIEGELKSLGDSEREVLNAQIKVLFNYKRFQGSVITPTFETNFDFRTCHYCNRAYITDVKKANGKIVPTYQLDHFYEKANYPYVSLSFYNFIPCCSTCNGPIKNSAVNSKEDDFFTKKAIAPNRSDFKFHEEVKFKTFLKKEVSLNTTDDFKIMLIEGLGKKYKEYISLLELNQRYESHKTFILDMIKKRNTYTDEKLEEISKMTNRPVKKMKEDLFGMYLHDDRLLEEPLNKLVQDIAYELGLV
jgi:hypothetical protein